MIIVGQTIGFWTAFIAALFILLHVPSCNKHWALRLKPLSTYLSKHHDTTLIIATIFALAHIIMSLAGLIFGVWV